MNNDKTQGVYCHSDRQFYYMDNGEGSSMHDVDKIRTVLIGRGLINMTDTRNPTTGYTIMSRAEAAFKELPEIALYLNSHIRKLRERQKNPQPSISIWD